MLEIFSHEFLKKKQRAERETHDPNLAIRVHRALSWLARAEACDDLDGEFIFLWIAFNAAYAQETGSTRPASTKETYRNFAEKINNFDHDKLIYNLIWDEYASSIRLLLANKYVFQPYWDYENNLISDEAWTSKFQTSVKLANKALSKSDTVTIVGLVLDRLYTLRNQLIHGGATWNGAVNRLQLSDGRNFLSKLVPIIILLMLENSGALWGPACYPVTNDKQS